MVVKSSAVLGLSDFFPSFIPKSSWQSMSISRAAIQLEHNDSIGEEPNRLAKNFWSNLQRTESVGEELVQSTKKHSVSIRSEKNVLTNQDRLSFCACAASSI